MKFVIKKNQVKPKNESLAMDDFEPLRESLSISDKMRVIQTYFVAYVRNILTNFMILGVTGWEWAFKEIASRKRLWDKLFKKEARGRKVYFG